MIYNESGEMVTAENPCYYIGESVFDFHVLREALETLDDVEYRAILNDIESEIRQCDQKYINKLDAIKQVELLSGKSRKLIGIWAGITGAGTVGTGIASVLFNGKTTIILLVICGFLFTAMIILLTILAHDQGKREQMDMNIIKLGKEIIEFYEEQVSNKNIPQKVKIDIILKLQGFKSKVDKICKHIENVKIQRELNNMRFNQQMQQMQINQQNQQIMNQQIQLNQINQMMM